ncbi:uncharacterized protein [Dermacentor andersoni]|uniref:uncharacterized protein n=1 Tax=Dermacentor andersoni TaxID=34620 RepID=UPI002417E18C|nr:uncharacterized protein LOC126540482 [Dermacentor andersoni]
MKTFGITVCLGLLATACAATLESPESEYALQQTEQDKKLQASVILLCESVDRWIETNKGLEPAELQQRLERLVDEAVKENKALDVLEDEDDAEDDSDAVVEYGLGKKLKKWRKKAKKALVDAAKVVAVNKVVGAAAGALG